MGLIPDAPELDLTASIQVRDLIHSQIMRGIPIRDEEAIQSLMVAHNQIVRLIKEVERLRNKP